MSITRKKQTGKSPGKEIKVSREAGESIEKELAKKAVAKKKVKKNAGTNKNGDVYDMSDPEQAKLAEEEIKKKIEGKEKKTTKKKVVKKTGKSEKVTSKRNANAKKSSNGQKDKKSSAKNVKKSTDPKGEKTAGENNNIDDALANIPEWFKELFEYLEKLDGISVLSQDEEKEPDPKKRITSYSPREMERKLFLIFMSSPKQIWNESSLRFERLLQKDFSIAANISENSLSEWKKQSWFKDNHATVMKEIFKARTPDILDSLYKGATTGVNEFGKRDAAAIKLWLQYIEGFTPGVDLSTGGEKIEVYFGNGNVGKSQFINKNPAKKGESSK